MRKGVEDAVIAYRAAIEHHTRCTEESDRLRKLAEAAHAEQSDAWQAKDDAARALRNAIEEGIE